MEKLKLQKEMELKAYPHSFWAKKFDKVVHLTRKDGHYATECGSDAALLGNNYAPDKINLPICTNCIKARIKRTPDYDGIG